MTIHVDLRSKILPRDHQIFMSRPGQGYRLYPEVSESSTILLELPGLGLERGLQLSEYDDLTARIRRARALLSWHNGKRHGDEPDRDLASYVRPRRKSASLSQVEAVVRGYFERAKKGDLVLVPPSAYSNDALIGEITSVRHNPVSLRVERLFGDDELNGRSVHWLARIQKRKLETGLLDIVEKPNAFVNIPQRLRKKLYDSAYGNYTLGDEYSARLDITRSSYESFDDLVVSTFINYVACNTRAIDLGDHGSARQFGQLSFEDLGSYDSDLRTNVNSPGTITLIGRAITPLTIAVMFALAVYVGPTALEAAQNDDIIIGNSLAPENDACTARVAQNVLDQLKLLGLNNWPEACERVREAARRAGIDSSVAVSPGNGVRGDGER